MSKTIAAVPLALALLTGCTSYVPLPSPRVSEVTQGYTRDGRMIPHGAFDSGLVQAVRGNPRAEERAETARALTIAAAVLDLAAGGLLGGGVYEITLPNSSDQRAGVGLTTAAAICLITGVILAGAAVPNKQDAINIYNDGVLPAGPPPEPLPFLPPPTGAAAGPRRDARADLLLTQ